VLSGGLEQADEHRVRRTRYRPQLRLVQRSQEEWVVDPLDGADLASRVGGSNHHPVLICNVLHLGYQAICTGRVLDHLKDAVECGETRPRCELDCDGLVLERAGKERDDGRAARTVLSVRRFRDPGQAASVLDQHMLKATSSADQWHASLSRRAHHCKDRLRIAVWAPWSDHHRRSRSGDEVDVTDRVSWHNSNLDRGRCVLRRMAECGESGSVVLVAGRQIDQHADDEAAHR
jgi:hypothetical protein